MEGAVTVAKAETEVAFQGPPAFQLRLASSNSTWKVGGALTATPVAAFASVTAPFITTTPPGTRAKPGSDSGPRFCSPRDRGVPTQQLPRATPEMAAAAGEAEG